MKIIRVQHPLGTFYTSTESMEEAVIEYGTKAKIDDGLFEWEFRALRSMFGMHTEMLSAIAQRLSLKIITLEDLRIYDNGL